MQSIFVLVWQSFLVFEFVILRIVGTNYIFAAAEDQESHGKQQKANNLFHVPPLHMLKL